MVYVKKKIKDHFSSYKCDQCHKPIVAYLYPNGEVKPDFELCNKCRNLININVDKYYVYIWFNFVTNEVIYVGKGTGNRAFQTNRANISFDGNTTRVCILINNLSEKNALIFESLLIKMFKQIGQKIVNVSLGQLVYD